MCRRSRRSARRPAPRRRRRCSPAHKGSRRTPRSSSCDGLTGKRRAEGVAPDARRLPRRRRPLQPPQRLRRRPGLCAGASAEPRDPVDARQRHRLRDAATPPAGEIGIDRATDRRPGHHRAETAARSSPAGHADCEHSPTEVAMPMREQLDRRAIQPVPRRCSAAICSCISRSCCRGRRSCSPTAACCPTAATARCCAVSQRARASWTHRWSCRRWSPARPAPIPAVLRRLDRDVGGAVACGTCWRACSAAIR